MRPNGSHIDNTPGRGRVLNNNRFIVNNKTRAHLAVRRQGACKEATNNCCRVNKRQQGRHMSTKPPWAGRSIKRQAKTATQPQQNREIAGNNKARLM